MADKINDVVIVGGTRTAVGRYGGSLTNLASYELASVVLKEVVNRSKLEVSIIDDVVLGSSYQSGHYPNTARQAVLRAGFPVEVPGVTIDRQCVSGLEAIAHGMRMIQTGDASVVLAGGAENMSNLPYYTIGSRWGHRLGHSTFYDWFSDASETVSGPPERVGKLSMGLTAENVAQRYGLTRKELDEYSLSSHHKAIKAIDTGKFKEEITSIEVQKGRENFLMDTDEHPRRDASLEAMLKLKPIFKEGGCVTAGNSCGMNDAAAALVLMSREKAESLGKTPWARLVAYAVAGVDPAYMGIGPVPSTDLALRKANLQMKDIELIELNEAFAAQAIAVLREWESRGLRSRDIVNVNGGGIALGHPIGATGARLIVTLLYEMRRRRSHYGLASACVGGGMGATLIVERL